MTSSQRRARRQNLLLRRQNEAPAADHLPEVPVIDAGTFDTPSTEPLPDVPTLHGATFDEPAAVVVAPAALPPVGPSARAIARGLRGLEEGF